MATIEETAGLLRCGTRTVERQLAAGRIVGVRQAGKPSRVLFSRSAVAAYLRNFQAARGAA